MSEHHSIIIIGAGLSGLYSAWKLHQKGHDVILLEARERTGGRILSPDYNQLGRFDMGPAWVWPNLQPRLQQLMTRLGLDVFEQYTNGDMLFEKNDRTIERYSGQSSHSHSYRLQDGSQSIVDALQANLPDTCLHLNTSVQTIHKSELKIDVLRSGEPYQYTADKIILAMPPRLVLENIKIEPALSDNIVQAWNLLSTWMASHCKMVFIYKKPFWREQKLSAEVFSHAGPLTEVYDGSPASEAFYALTAFVGLNAQQRQQISEEQLIEYCLAQLQRVFGDESQQVLSINIKDWSQEKNTCSALDLKLPAQHPHYEDNMPRSFWNNTLILAGTEVAREHGGYLEGAIESGDEAVKLCV